MAQDNRTRTQPARHKRTGPPADGLQAAARRVRLERPARDRRARPDHLPLNYELELANFAAIPDHEQEPEEPAPEEPSPANLDPSDLFAYFFRVQAERAREAFILNGN